MTSLRDHLDPELGTAAAYAAAESRDERNRSALADVSAEQIAYEERG